MISWPTILYGAALSAILALILTALLPSARRPAVLASIAAGAFAGPVAWNAILRSTSADQFFTDAPIPVFPVSWQDTGSGVFALATLAVILGLGALRAAPGRQLTLLACIGAISALVVDVYLY